MSRLGKTPVLIPKDVKVTVDGSSVQVEGKKGRLSLALKPQVSVAVEKDPHQILVTRNGNAKHARAMHGTTRAHLANMVRGVVEGFEKVLEISGSGFGAKLQGNTLQMNVGFTHSVNLTVPEGLKVVCPNPATVVVSGMDKHQVGQFAAIVRDVRRVEPFKLKGIKYRGERIRKKAGKAAVGTAK